MSIVWSPRLLSRLGISSGDGFVLYFGRLLRCGRVLFHCSDEREVSYRGHLFPKLSLVVNLLKLRASSTFAAKCYQAYQRVEFDFVSLSEVNSYFNLSFAFLFNGTQTLHIEQSVFS